VRALFACGIRIVRRERDAAKPLALLPQEAPVVSSPDALPARQHLDVGAANMMQ